MQGLEVDEVQVGFHANLQRTAIIQSDAAGRVPCLHLHRLFQPQTVTSTAVAHVEAQHLCGYAGIA